MKKLCSLALLVVAMVFTSQAVAQKFDGLDKSPMDMAYYPANYRDSDKVVRVIYSRPQLKGRSLSELAPAGKVWRTGANEASEITFYKDVNLGGKSISAGTYALFTIPGKDEWTVVLNNNLNQWGAYSYSESGDVARVMASASTGDSTLDAFSITFKEVDKGVHMVMGWDKIRVAVPVTW